MFNDITKKRIMAIFLVSIMLIAGIAVLDNSIHYNPSPSPETSSSPGSGSGSSQCLSTTSGNYYTATIDHTTFDVGETASWSTKETTGYSVCVFIDNSAGSQVAKLTSPTTSTGTVTYKFSSSGSYTWYVETNGAYKSSIDSITVNSAPSVSSSSNHNPVDAKQSVTFSTSTSGGTSSYSYQWYDNSNAVSGATSSSWKTSFSSSGTQSVYVKMTDATGYSVTSSTISQTVDSALSSSLSSSKNPSDAGQSVTFSTSTSGGSGSYSYSYVLYDGTSSSDSQFASGSSSSFSYTFSSSGSYLLDYTVSDTNGNSKSLSLTQSVNSDTNVSIKSSQNPIDVGSTVQFSSSVSSGTGPYNFSWRINGNTYFSKDVNYTFTSSGSYTIDLTVTDAAGYKVSTSTSETVNSDPTVSGSSNVSSADVNYPIEFSSSPSGGTGGYTYSWVLNGNQVSTSQDFSYSFSSSGSYTLTVTITDSVGQSSSSSVTVTINSNPSVTEASSQNPTDVGNSVTFTPTLSGGTGSMTYSWLVNGVQESTSSQFSYSFSSSGTYYVNLTVTDSDGHTAFYSFKETVNPDPSVTIKNSPAPTDIGVPAEFKAVVAGGTGPYNFTWSINGQDFYTRDVNYTFTSSGTFPVSLTVKDVNGNTASGSVKEVVNPPPSVTIKAEYNPVDQGANDTFTAQVSGGTGPYNFTWENVTGSHIILGYGSKFTYKWNGTGTYQIEVLVNDSLGEKVNYTLSVSVIPRPSTSIEGPDRVDKGISNTWVGNSTNGTAPYKYTWFVNGVSSGSGLFFTYSFPQAGTYHLELVSNDSEGVITKAYLNVTVSASPAVSLTEQYQQVDAGIPVDFNSSVSGGTGPFQWQFSISGIGFVGYQANLTYVFNNPGNYTITVMVIDAEGISSELNLSITVTAPPSVSLKAQYPIVDPNLTDLFNSSESGGIGGYDFKWYVNGSYEGNGSELNYSFSLPGIYPVIVKVTDSFGMSSQSGLDVIVRNYPQASILASSNVTDVGVNVSFRPSLTGGVGPYSYKWLANGHVYDTQDLSISFGSQGEYTVQLIVSDYLGRDTTSSFNVSVYPDPVAKIYYNGTPVVSKAFPIVANITGGLGPYRVQWIFPSGQQESGSSIKHVFQYSGPRTVEIVIRDATGFYGTQNFSINVGLFISADANVTSGYGPLAVHFSSTALGGSAYSYNWSFGNGVHSLQQDPLYIFHAGNYTVHLTITSSNGATGSETIHIQSLPPPVHFKYSSNLNITQSFNFTAIPNWDSSGPYTVSWSFPNGQTLSGMNIQYKFPAYHEFNTVIVTFTFNNTTITKDIQVRMIPSIPTISLKPPRELEVGTMLSLNATACAPDSSSFSYLWDINGSSFSGQNQLYFFNNPGNYTVQVTVTDGLGATSNASKTIDVLPSGTNKTIAITYSKSVSGPHVYFTVRVRSLHGISAFEVLMGTKLLNYTETSTSYSSSGTIAKYNISLNQRDYSSGVYSLDMIAFNNRSQTNHISANFVVSSQYSISSFSFTNIIDFFGGLSNFIIVVLTLAGIGIAWASLRRQDNPDLIVEGENQKGKARKIVLKGKK